jgi:hypothetical protein
VVFVAAAETLNARAAVVVAPTVSFRRVAAAVGLALIVSFVRTATSFMRAAVFAVRGGGDARLSHVAHFRPVRVARVSPSALVVLLRLAGGDVPFAAVVTRAIAERVAGSREELLDLLLAFVENVLHARVLVGAVAAAAQAARGVAAALTRRALFEAGGLGHVSGRVRVGGTDAGADVQVVLDLVQTHRRRLRARCVADGKFEGRGPRAPQPFATDTRATMAVA